MTHTDAPTTQPVARTEAPFGDDDPRMTFGKAVALGTAVIGAVRPDQLDDPTPCPGMAVRDLLAHLTQVLGRVAAVGRGRDALTVDAPAGVPDDGWQQVWLDTAHQVQAAWTDRAVLERTVALPWDQGPGGQILEGFTNEVTVHTWDLARATGQRPAWDDHVVAVALAAIRRTLPAEGRIALFEAVRQGMGPEAAHLPPPFAEAEPVADGAPLIDQLVAYNGRRP